MQSNEESGLAAHAPPCARGDMAHRRTYRTDYQPPSYLIDRVDIRFELAIPVTRVTTTLSMRRVGEQACPLVLDGERLRLVSLALDGQPLASGRCALDEHSLTIFDPTPAFEITTVVDVSVVDNPGLEGLNHAADTFFTHCEPEGFRRITYFCDRPDVLARYRCTLVADAAIPTLLSNGHLQDSGFLSDGRRYACWEDPHPKASYLFALIAGSFAKLTDSFVTRSGRRVRLAVHAQPDDLPFCGHGLMVLKQAMAWDERAYGREFDLDALNVVVMRSYPGGAMECKGLNLYATEFFLAAPEISTDEELLKVTATVGHEYFHNWSGNRVGCRDWFELSLKEGFTVFRQQQFMAALLGETDARIADVIRLRELQFPEDEGGAAHAVRPASYLAINNFYTRTVYEKGAELIRMMCLLVGEQVFRAAAEEFFARYDGCAATIDSLIDTIERTSGTDLAQFRRWYDFVGRPLIDVQGAYDAAAGCYTLTLQQRGSSREPAAAPLHIPLRLGLLGWNGEPLPLLARPDETHWEKVLQLRAERESFVFENLAEPPIPAVFRGFSAPVEYSIDLDDDALALLAMRDADGVSRWMMAQQLVTRTILRSVAAGGTRPDTEAWFRVVAHTLETSLDDVALAGRILCLPSLRQLAQSQVQIDVESLSAARVSLARETTRCFRSILRHLRAQVAAAAKEEDGYHARRLRNLSLWYLLQDAELLDIECCRQQFHAADKMDDIAAALQLLVDRGGSDREEALHQFYERRGTVPAALDRWFGVQAASTTQDSAQRLALLMRHPGFSFDNATRLKAIFDPFTANWLGFHQRSGRGYAVVIDLVLALNEPNPRLAARFLKHFDGWQRFDPVRRDHLRRALERVLAVPGLARDLYEIASQGLSCGDRSVAADVSIHTGLQYSA